MLLHNLKYEFRYQTNSYLLSNSVSIPDILWTDLDLLLKCVCSVWGLAYWEKHINLTEFQRILKQEIGKYVKSNLGYIIFACLKPF